MTVITCPHCTASLTSMVESMCPHCGATLTATFDDTRGYSLGSVTRGDRLPTCPSAEELIAYLADELNDSTSERIETHINECDLCERFLANYLRDDCEEGLATSVRERATARGCSIRSASGIPERIGRYDIVKEIGQGGFGSVYLAEDRELSRSVAIKIPHTIDRAGYSRANDMLAEAQALAQLDHPNIVTVFDSGRMDDGRCFIVSKYIEGQTLDTYARSNSLTWQRAVEIVALLAEGVHTAHRVRLIHRDIKPTNILIGTNGQPYLADFGLALRDTDYGDEQWQGGTLGYLSPEQARGEGHLVDGRSDVFSLGVVLYELLTGQLPFRGRSPQAMLEHVQRANPRPPRQITDGLPVELDRVCLRCLERSPLHRYSTAADLARDLRQLLDQSHVATGTAVSSKRSRDKSNAPGAVAPAAHALTWHGLRSFEQEDHAGYLQLLPGPFDQRGLPEPISFWLDRLASPTKRCYAEQFRVGLIYGPSGCGKTSLLRAGIVPCLSPDTVPIILEASPARTHLDLLRAVQQRFPFLTESRDLVDALKRLRLNLEADSSSHVVLLLDQFEQCLHEPSNSSQHMVDALRQCDGAVLQALVLVREEYWMAATRFFERLDLNLTADNSHAVDRLSQTHARKALVRLGQAVGRLSAEPAELTAEQQRFVVRAIDSLTANDGRISPIHLSLLVDMTKEVDWTSDALRGVGDWKGIGVAFLQNALSAETASPHRRRWLSEMKQILRCLLPSPSRTLRDEPRSRDELQRFTGVSSIAEFDQILNCLDHELHLVTPVDVDTGTRDKVDSVSSTTYYQLTHDHLVPAIREWLDRNDQRSFRGRARRLLRERTDYWSSDRSTRQLPSLVELVHILIGTRTHNWNPVERRLVSASVHHHARRIVAVAILVIIGISSWRWQRQRREYEGVVQDVSRLHSSRLEQIPALVAELAETPKLSLAALANAGQDKLNTRDIDWRSIARMYLDGQYSPDTLDRLLRSSEDELFIFQQMFVDRLPESFERQLQTFLENAEEKSPSALLRALSMLAYSSSKPIAMSSSTSSLIVDGLLNVPTSRQDQWLRYVDRYRDALARQILQRLEDATLGSESCDAARSLLTTLARDMPDVLAARSVFDEDPFVRSHFKQLQPSDAISKTFANLLDQALAVAANDMISAELKRRSTQQAARAAAAVALFGDRSRVWPLLRRQSDDSLRTRLIATFPQFGVTPHIIADQLMTHDTDSGIRAALLMLLGGYELSELPAHLQTDLPAWVGQLAVADRDAEANSAAVWLINHWQLPMPPAKSTSADSCKHGMWYRDPSGYAMVVLEAGEFLMGTAPDAAERTPAEPLHRQHIEHRFAIATTEVTVVEYERYLAANGLQRRKEVAKIAPFDDCPQTLLTWSDAARYCNWLSQQAGLKDSQWCYVDTLTDGRSALLPALNSLERTGYRMPTEAEWEHACRAGTTTGRFHGESAEWLGQYGWCDAPTTAPLARIARLRPNPLGLFDVYGNALEWCHNSPGQYDVGNQSSASGTTRRSQRGGHRWQRPQFVRSAIRYSDVPDAVNFAYGLRVARTLE